MNLELFFGKISLLVKLVAVYLFSIVSYFILDIMLSFGGITPIDFIVYFITRAVIVVFILSLIFGIQARAMDFVLAMLIFDVPIISLTEVLTLFGIFIEIPLPPYVSLIQSTLIMALLYEFPRLILLIVIIRFLYGKRPTEGVRSKS